MLSRRSILRAIGFGATAAAVAAAVGVPPLADVTLTTNGAYPATMSLRDGAITAERINVGTLTAINANMGNVTAGSLRSGGDSLADIAESIERQERFVARMSENLAIRKSLLASMRDGQAQTAKLQAWLSS